MQQTRISCQNLQFAASLTFSSPNFELLENVNTPAHPNFREIER